MSAAWPNLACLYACSASAASPLSLWPMRIHAVTPPPASSSTHDDHHQDATNRPGALAGRAVGVGIFVGRLRRGRRRRRRLGSRRILGRGRVRPAAHGRRLPLPRRHLARRLLDGRRRGGRDGRRLRRHGGTARPADGRRLFPGGRRRASRGGFRLGRQDGHEVADRAGALAIAWARRRRGDRGRGLRGIRADDGEHLPALRVGAAHRLAAQGIFQLVAGFTGRTDGGD